MPLQHDDVKYAWVVHTESPNDFYVQLSETYPQLEEMIAEIAEVYSGLADDLGPDDLVIGHPVCAQFAEDGCWYRAVIQSVPSEFEVEVQYIDYGNSDVILLSDVRQLSRRFFDLPMQAVHCCLDLPGLESFKQRVEDKELTVKFLSSKRGKWKVSLYDDDGKIGPSDTTPVVAMPEDSDGIFQIVEFIQPNITQEMKQQLYVSHIVSPDEFYVQFETALDDLTDLSERIGQFYSFLQPSENVLKNPSPGMSCCARFSEDGNWYRGRIKRVTPHGVEVEFVDYGNGEVVNFSEVKDPEKPFMQLPQQAILCGLDATKDQWSSEEINIFKSVALDKSFVAKFIIQDGPKWRVSLESGGTSVVDMFMTKDAVDLQKTNFKNIPGMQSETFAQLQLSSGQIEEVYVSHVTESGDFYVQLSKTSSDLALVENQISEIYDQLGPTTETMEVCFVDSLCCAKYSEDFKWYRARVTKVLSESEVEVHFVDYGNTDCLSVASMKQLRSNLLKFPMQAIKCRLEGSKDIWTESDVEQFEANVSERPLHVTFTRQEETTWFVTIQELDMFSTKAKLTTKEKSFTKEAFDVNKREEAYFLFADSPDCFWLQLVRTGSALEELMGQIASEASDQPLERSQVKVGLPCLGRYTENDLWHRAQILNVQDDANVTVSYVDYGNQETIPLDRLCPISYSHLKLPAQGIHCRLAEVQGVDPGKITEYLNEEVFEKVVEVEVQTQHADGSYTVKLFTPGVLQPLNDQIVGECLGDTSLVEETMLEHASPQKQTVTEERRSFKLPELQSGSKVPVSFISAFLPAEMQLLLTERVEERDQLMEEITSMYQALDENELELEKPEVGMLCCVHFSDKWFRGVIISLSADDTATVKLVDCGTYEKIPISELKLLKDELLKMPVFVVESSLANIQPSSEDGQWSPECSDALESLCRSKALTAEITQVLGDMVELILNDESGKQVNQSLVDLGYAKSCDIQDDFFGEQPGLKWPKLETGQSLNVHLMSVKDLKSIQLQLGDPEACLSAMMDQLSALYSNLGETEEVIRNPRVGQVCCAQFSEDHDWYRAVVTCVSAEGVEVKFVDYGNADIAVMIKQLREEFISLPVQCIDCSLNGVVPAAENSDNEIALKLMELCESKQLKAEVTNVSGDSVAVNLFDESGETRLSVADSLVKLGLALPQPTQREEPRRVSISEDGKIVYNYPESGDSIHNVSLASTKSPSDFWCELSGSKLELMSLSEKVEAFYQSLGENDLRFLCLQVGDTCCAQFTDDNKWCRSQVSEVCSDGQVCVRSVDYVKQETLTINRIKKLEAKFAILPVQALYCSLHGIEPPHKYYGEEWTSDAVGRFQELCQGEDVKIKIKEQDGSVTLVELIDSAGLSIGSQLLSEGLAVEVKFPLTESPVKDLQKQQDNLSAEQANEVDKESSEENVFEDAESGIDRVEKLADVAVDEERTENEEAKEAEDEEEFHDSSDHVREDLSSEDVKEDSVPVLEEAVLEATSEQLVEEEGFKTPVQVQEEAVLEATSEQLKEGEEKKEGEGIKTQIVEEVIDENSKEISSPECEEGLEEVNKEVINEIGKELETSESDKQSQAVFEEVNEEQTEAPIDETLVVSEDVNCPAEEETSKVDNTEKVEGAEEQGEEFVDNTDGSVDSGYTGQGISVEPKMEEDQVTRETSEEKIEGAEEQDEDFVEAQDVLTETFSEEEISGTDLSSLKQLLPWLQFILICSAVNCIQPFQYIGQ